MRLSRNATGRPKRRGIASAKRIATGSAKRLCYDSAFLAIFHFIGIDPDPDPLAPCGVYSQVNDAKFRLISTEKPVVMEPTALHLGSSMTLCGCRPLVVHSRRVYSVIYNAWIKNVQHRHKPALP